MELGLPASLGRTWFLIDDTVHVPGPDQPPAEVVLMKREAFRRLASEVRDTPARVGDELSEEQRRRAVAEYAAGYGLDEAQLGKAIAAFQESAEDPMDEGVAAYLAQEWSRAEPFFRQAVADAEKRKEEAWDRLLLSLEGDEVFVEAPFDSMVAKAMRSVSRSEVADLPDRIIAATARFLEVPVISRDGKIRHSSVKTIW